MITTAVFYSIAGLFSLVTGILYTTLFVRTTRTKGFSSNFIASLARVFLGVIFVTMLLRLPPLMSILMMILCVGAASITLRYTRPT